jgi:hypothetical protein
MDPLGVIWGQTSGWDEAVEVRMSQQILAPGVEDREEANLCSQVARIPGDRLKGLRTGVEQEVIEDLLVLQRQLGKLMRQGEDHVDIGNCQEFILASGDPLLEPRSDTWGNGDCGSC